MNDTPADLTTLFDAAQAAADQSRVLDTIDGVNVVLVPPGYSVQTVDLSHLALVPRRQTGHPRFDTSESLCTYVARHTTGGTLGYATPTGVKVVINGHDGGYDGGQAGWGDHVAELTWVQTEGWKRWTSISGKLMGQEEFAELVEAGLAEIASPPGADVLELAQSLHATTSAQFRSDKRLANGQVKVSYIEEIDGRAGAAGDMMIPSTVTLVAAPFIGADPVTLTARFRYRLQGGRLTMGVIINNVDETLRDAAAAEVDKIQALLGVSILWGRP